jgi:hypothetical protein
MATAAPLLPQTDVAGMYRPAGTLDVDSALLPYRGPWSQRLAAHLLRRAGFGGTQTEIARAAASSMDGAVDALLDFAPADSLPPVPDLYDPRTTLRDALAGGLRLRQLDDGRRRELLTEIRKGERRSIIALQHWWLNRMLATPAPLQEKMTLYFHGHFTTAAIQKGVTPQMAYDQNQLFRSNALGNLRELTWNVSIDPAMLIYLDNAGNDAQHPNENYARELMELFTLGVDRFSENDVRESARAWTGWRVNRPTGEARFVPARHDDGSKTFLGRTGNFSGRDVVEIIYSRPECAAFWASSLLNAFLYNAPEPQLVDAVASLLSANDYELRPVISMLLRSNVFYSSRAYRALVTSPVQFVVGTYKALGLAAIDERAQRALVQMGQILFYPPNVAGWPGGVNWLTSQTTIARENFVSGLVNASSATQPPWMQGPAMNASAAANRIVAEILCGDASTRAIAQLGAYLDGAGTSALGTLSAENYQERLRGAAYLAMAMPAYQLA